MAQLPPYNRTPREILASHPDHVPTRSLDDWEEVRWEQGQDRDEQTPNVAVAPVILRRHSRNIIVAVAVIAFIGVAALAVFVGVFDGIFVHGSV